MSRVLALISRLIDWLESLGEPPIVNPQRVKDGQFPPIVGSTSSVGGFGWFILVLLCTAALWLGALFIPTAGGGFIYAEF